jgi:hyaluronoglucosaminidase
MTGTVFAAGKVAPVARSFAVRGVVEGFYGTPWTHEARLEVISFLAGHGMNAYVYAPKDDPKHRADWRTPYDEHELATFASLAQHAKDRGVRFGFAISPGLDIDYRSERERTVLLGKLNPLRETGVLWFLLLLDDIPMRPGLAAEHAELATWLLEALGDAQLTLCPTEYVGTHPSPYLSDLGAKMPREIDIMWTGPTVCSPQLHADDARGWATALGERRVIVWDNYPVNDALMTASLHLGPYSGRDPDLADIVGGVLCNPMTQARASQIALATAMDFLREPDAYDAPTSWAAAITQVGGTNAAALAVLARACADSPIAEPDTLDLAQRVDALEDELDGPGWIAAVADVAAELRAAHSLADVFQPGAAPLADEVEPWAQAARRQSEAGLAALRLLQQCRPVAAAAGTGPARAAPPDPERSMHAALGVLFVWQGARADQNVVYGPRFSVYTPVVQMADGAPALDAAAALREDRNAIDMLCRLALRTYDSWRLNDAHAPLRVFVDGAERPLAADGTFDDRGDVVLLRQGSLCTRVPADRTLPFTEPRFA